MKTNEQTTNQPLEKRALVVEDDPSARGIIRRATEEYRERIDYATNVQDGLDLVHKSIEQARPYGVAYMDIGLPSCEGGEMNRGGGVRVIRELGESSPDTEIVVMSSHANHMAEKMGMRAVDKLKAGEDLAKYLGGGAN